MSTTATELDRALVLGFESELRCEVNHTKLICSESVTHVTVSKCSGHRVLKCANAAGRDLRRMDEGALCAACFSRAQGCWKVIPV